MRDEGIFVSRDPQADPITISRGSSPASNKEDLSMAFFNSAVGVMQTLVVALGAGLGIWGAINLRDRQFLQCPENNERCNDECQRV
jgi:hypothetical protein